MATESTDPRMNRVRDNYVDRDQP